MSCGDAGVDSLNESAGAYLGLTFDATIVAVQRCIAAPVTAWDRRG
jgi:hypothetical protein